MFPAASIRGVLFGIIYHSYIKKCSASITEAGLTILMWYILVGAGGLKVKSDIVYQLLSGDFRLTKS